MENISFIQGAINIHYDISNYPNTRATLHSLNDRIELLESQIDEFCYNPPNHPRAMITEVQDLDYIIDRCKPLDATEIDDLQRRLYHLLREAVFKRLLSIEMMGGNNYVSENANYYEKYIINQHSVLPSERSAVKKIKDILLRLDKANKREFSSLKEMFYNKNLYDGSLEILSKVDPPVISENGEFIKGRLKSAIGVWYDELNDQGVIKYCYNRDHLSELINDVIPNLGVSGSALRKISPRAKERYKSEFKTLISRLKLSQK